MCVQPKQPEKSISAYPGYPAQRPRKQVTYPSYATYDNRKTSSPHMDGAQGGYTKPLDPQTSRSYTFSRGPVESVGFSNEPQRTPVVKQMGHYPTTSGHLTGTSGHGGQSVGSSGVTVSPHVSGHGPAATIQHYGASVVRHSPQFETIQRCSPDSTISTNSPKQPVYGDMEAYGDRGKQHRALTTGDIPRTLEHSQGYSLKGTSACGTFTEPHVPTGSIHGSMYPSISVRGSSPGSISRGSPSFRGNSPSSLRAHTKGASRGNSPSGGRNVSPYLSHSLSPLVHSAMSSPVVPVSRPAERSIIRGTSGALHSPPGGNQDIHSSTHVCDSKIGIASSPAQRLFPDRVSLSPNHGAPTKPSAVPGVYIKDEKSFSIPKHVPLPRTAFSCEKSLKNDIKIEQDVKCPNMVASAGDVRKTEEPEVESYTYPLTIAIPGSVASSSNPPKQPITSKDCKVPEPVVKAPRPYSKKQIIMNAVNNDECLKKIVNTVTPPRPKAVPSVPSDHLSQFKNSSPTFPESPKMPTLSPQQKFSPAMVSPLIGDPPTLDLLDMSSQRMRIEQGCKLPMMRKYSIGFLPEKMENRSEEGSSSVEGDNRPCRPDYSFSKWSSSYNKNIPVANVSPMVHGHSTTSSKVKSDVRQNDATGTEPREQTKTNDIVNKSDEIKPPSVKETFVDLKFEERYSDDDLVVLSKDDVIKFTDSRNIYSKLHDHKQRSDRHLDDEKSTFSDSPLDTDEENTYSRDRKSSISADKSRSSSADKTRSLLAEIANSDGYVAEAKGKGKTEDLRKDDPTTMGREERALLVSYIYRIYSRALGGGCI